MFILLSVLLTGILKTKWTLKQVTKKSAINMLSFNFVRVPTVNFPFILFKPLHGLWSTFLSFRHEQFEGIDLLWSCFKVLSMIYHLYHPYFRQISGFYRKSSCQVMWNYHSWYIFSIITFGQHFFPNFARPPDNILILHFIFRKRKEKAYNLLR